MNAISEESSEFVMVPCSSRVSMWVYLVRGVIGDEVTRVGSCRRDYRRLAPKRSLKHFITLLMSGLARNRSKAVHLAQAQRLVLFTRTPCPMSPFGICRAYEYCFSASNRSMINTLHSYQLLVSYMDMWIVSYQRTGVDDHPWLAHWSKTSWCPMVQIWGTWLIVYASDRSRKFQLIEIYLDVDSNTLHQRTMRRWANRGTNDQSLVTALSSNWLFTDWCR